MKIERPIFPLFLFRPKTVVEPASSHIAFNAYSLGQKNFAKLADQNMFAGQNSSCIQVDISDECERMNEENFLEITVPVLTLNDLMGSVKFLDQFIRHPVLLTVNGYGAKIEGENNFPYVDFINVRDIADNRYEIIISPTGNLELPREGFGLYTMIKEITYVLSYRQVIKGDGLADLTSVGAHKKSITFQPPMNTGENFKFYICLTHIDRKNRRIVDSIRPVEINFLSPTIQSNIPVLSPRLLYVKFDTSSPSVPQKEIMGWKPHPICNNVWIKRFGLQLSTRENLIRLLYNEHEFMRDFLAKKVLTFSSCDNYNDFLLRPETFSKIYEKFVHDIVHGYISKTFLFTLLDENVLERIDFTKLSSDFHDKAVLSQFKKEMIAQKNLLQHFLEIVFGDPEPVLPPSSAQVAMVPIVEGEHQAIPEIPAEWASVSNCTSRPKML